MGRHARPLRHTRGHELFREFSRDANLAEIARLSGVTREMVRKLAAGQVGPGIGLALKLEEVTYGKVPIASWVQRPEGVFRGAQPAETA